MRSLNVLTRHVLARVKLNNDPMTFILSYKSLSRASSISILPEIAPFLPDFDIANYTRCVSGAFYDIAGTLYQAMRYGNAVNHACLERKLLNCNYEG